MNRRNFLTTLGVLAAASLLRTEKILGAVRTFFRPRTLYVDSHAAPGGDGLTEATAFCELGDAVMHAQASDTIKVRASWHDPEYQNHLVQTFLPNDNFIKFLKETGRI